MSFSLTKILNMLTNLSHAAFSSRSRMEESGVFSFIKGLRNEYEKLNTDIMKIESRCQCDTKQRDMIHVDVDPGLGLMVSCSSIAVISTIWTQENTRWIGLGRADLLLGLDIFTMKPVRKVSAGRDSKEKREKCWLGHVITIGGVWLGNWIY
jgi:hypothetical protein